jgi:hypothetical protein
VIDPLPELPKPVFSVVHQRSTSDVPFGVARELLEIGVPCGMIGYEYRSLSEAEFLEGVLPNGLVAFGRSGLLGRIGVDVATGEVVHIPKAESTKVTHANKDIPAFTRCVSAVIDRFPFYQEGAEEEEFERVADELRHLIVRIDETALVHNGFWDGVCEDVAMGDYADWDA